jgi:gamma-glutamylaminecyclotransferase
MRYKIFVYGTLKEGFCNHRLLKDAKFLGKARTKEAYPLIAPKVWYPYLIDAPGEGKRVLGELYEVDLPTLKRIDRLEEYPRYYIRKTIEVIDEEGRSHKALAYFLASKIPYKKFPYLEEFIAEQQ